MKTKPHLVALCFLLGASVSRAEDSLSSAAPLTVRMIGTTTLGPSGHVITTDSLIRVYPIRNQREEIAKAEAQGREDARRDMASAHPQAIIVAAPLAVSQSDLKEYRAPAGDDWFAQRVRAINADRRERGLAPLPVGSVSKSGTPGREAWVPLDQAKVSK